MADTQTNPQNVALNPSLDPGSVTAAQDAILGLLDSSEQPAQEEQPSEETEDVEVSDEATEETEEVEEEVRRRRPLPGGCQAIHHRELPGDH